jgi:hypothetical protein
VRRRAAAKGGTTFDEVGAEDQIAAIRVQKSMLVRKGGVERGVVFHIHFILHTSYFMFNTPHFILVGYVDHTPCDTRRRSRAIHTHRHTIHDG